MWRRVVWHSINLQPWDDVYTIHPIASNSRYTDIVGLSQVLGAGAPGWTDNAADLLTSTKIVQALIAYRHKVLADEDLLQGGRLHIYRPVTEFTLEQHARPSQLLSD